MGLELTREAKIMIWMLAMSLLTAWMLGTYTSDITGRSFQILLVLAVIMVIATLFERRWLTTA